MSSLKALINPVTPFEQNAPIIYCENTKKCAFVDPDQQKHISLYSHSKLLEHFAQMVLPD